jgi:hypothetical protein
MRAALMAVTVWAERVRAERKRRKRDRIED